MATDRTIDTRVPVLMYHEIADSLPDKNDRFMTPMYVITAAMFEGHLRTLAEHGYRSLLLDEVDGVDPGGKYVVITFDDGLAGNFTHAFPLLTKYGFKATFFVAVNAVGGARYMTWSQIENLSRNGMSIQSHTVSHRPLETLSGPEIRNELQGSRDAIEKRLGTRVSAISFPHGSYTPEIVQMAQQVGYRYVCTSDVERTSVRSFLQEPALLGRLAMTNTVDNARLLSWVTYSSAELLKTQYVKRLKTLVRKTIGVKNYGRLYRLYFKIK